MADTSIEWTDVTWNPVAGCSIASAGCSNCYAMRMATRLEAMGLDKYQGLTRKSGSKSKWTGIVKLDPASLSIPLKWKKPRRVFVNSMSDLFHPDVPTEFIRDVWNVMAQTPHHTYQILTKRPDTMGNVLSNLSTLPNVWIGTSIEDKDNLWRLETLREIRAAVRFVSFEPLIGSVKGADLEGIHWAIVGGESGPQARTMDEEWVDEIHSACKRTGTAFFFKQWGGRNKKAAGRSFRNQFWDEMPVLSI